MMRTVLFVDDDPALLDAMRRGLRHERYEIMAASSAQDAMRVLESRDVAVVVSDDHMPGISGSDFLSQIRILFPRTLRIMLTGQATPQTMAQAVNEGGVYRYLTKPCAHATLAEAVRQALAQGELFDQCREALRLLRRQTQALERIAETHPALVRKVIAEEDEAVTVVEDDFDNASDLASRIAVRIRQGGSMFPGQPAPGTA